MRGCPSHEEQDVIKRDIHVLNGSNLILLGTRDTGIYGSVTLSEIHHNLQRRAGDRASSILFVERKTHVNASRAASRPPAHDSGPMWVATPSL
ncbi:type II 3-dehydroquinate dehydratase [Microvirga sp. 3-52]|uniref:type II 3-dehydroquinate dehydratase n=1 Tax=Microvirga sp. 3-52 TaxID=2792425 RepID=UPI001AD2E2CC|nr:type II 3-dehydroquinate dehydratase [Microvirga sp. 3-52]MBO1908685.1 type II 3-dehydroquinate dehydratase [Microvirga sp. 3-52]MBS7455142.1 type II 3-dehydroquinate dehydratase [Microvirga sp. 3-52]